MDAKPVTVQWDLSEQITLDWPTTHNVAEFIELIYERLAPSTNGSLESVTFCLYRLTDGRPCQLEPRVLPGSIGIRPSERFFFANARSPWWIVTHFDCEVEVIEGQVVTVPPEGLVLSRSYLLDQMPPRMAQRHRQEYISTLKSPLSRVSRKAHCEISSGPSGWQLRRYADTFIDGSEWRGPEPYALPERAVKVMLGADGWTVRVQVRRREQQVRLGGA